MQEEEKYINLFSGQEGDMHVEKASGEGFEFYRACYQPKAVISLGTFNFIT